MNLQQMLNHLATAKDCPCLLCYMQENKTFIDGVKYALTA